MRAGGYGIQVARDLVDGLFYIYNRRGKQVILLTHLGDIEAHRFSHLDSPVYGMGATACSA
jgi:hypothetical protein